MEITHLPILAATTSLKDSVKAMRIQQRSAVVREEPTKLELIKITKIFKALGQNLTELSNVKISQPVYRSTPAEISSRNLDLKTPNNSWADWNSFMNSVASDYILIDSYLGTALVVTRHEGQSDEIETSPSDCYCLGPDEHSIPEQATIVPVYSCSVCSNSVHCE